LNRKWRKLKGGADADEKTRGSSLPGKMGGVEITEAENNQEVN